MKTISISTDFLGHTHRETISSRNSIAIINHISRNALNCFIIAAKTYLCLYVSILWSDLESSRMCLWNKIPIPPLGARSNVYHPCKIQEIFPESCKSSKHECECMSLIRFAILKGNISCIFKKCPFLPF